MFIQNLGEQIMRYIYDVQYMTSNIWHAIYDMNFLRLIPILHIRESCKNSNLVIAND